jgi:flagellar biogenesis protein FliO
MMDGSWTELGWRCWQAALPAAAEAVATPAPDFPFWSHLFRVIAVLSGMLGVLLLGLHFWKKSSFGRTPAGSNLIQVLATHYLAPKKALLLVAVGRERFLLASTSEQLQLVTRLTPADAAAAEPRSTGEGKE